MDFALKCARAGCDSAVAGFFEVLPGRDGSRPPGARQWCSNAHREQDIMEDLRRPKCAVCGKPLETVKTNTAGRPRVYCGSTCQSAREKQLARALKDLAREVMPEDGDGERLLAKVRSALYDAETLRAFWNGRWGVKPTVSPSPRARQALADRITALGEQKRIALLLKDQQIRDRVRAQEDSKLRAHRQQQAAEDARWRDELVKGLG